MTAQLSDETAIVCKRTCKRRRRDMFIAPDIKYPLSSVGAACRKNMSLLRSFIQCAFQIYKHVAPPALSLDFAGLNKMLP
jgi:hypothetical protein